MKSSKRALRRYQKARVKAKARRVYPHDRQAKSADHLAVCSCWMCGNPRKWYGEPTIQERKAWLDENAMESVNGKRTISRTWRINAKR